MSSPELPMGEAQQPLPAPSFLWSSSRGWAGRRGRAERKKEAMRKATTATTKNKFLWINQIRRVQYQHEETLIFIYEVYFSKFI